MRRLFTVNLYDYLSIDKAKVCKDYQERNKEVIEFYNEKVPDENKWQYEQIDIDEGLDKFVKDKSICMSEHMPVKYKYQMISDLVRYKYMMKYPDSIYIDTDFCILGPSCMTALNSLSELARSLELDYMAGELNKNRLFPCNWLMIGSGVKDNIFVDMYNMLKERMTVQYYENYMVPADSKWQDKMEAWIWNELWGYAIPRELNSSKFRMLPYELFQGCEWNKDWHDTSIMKKKLLVGCHFFGFGEGGRPDWKEFVEYHRLENNLGV